MANLCQVRRLDLFWNAMIAVILQIAIKLLVGARLKRFYKKISCVCGEMLGMLLIICTIIKN